VRAVERNRAKGWAKGQATLEARCATLQSYAEHLRRAHIEYERRCLRQLGTSDV
jgi:hypothetical protein